MVIVGVVRVMCYRFFVVGVMLIGNEVLYLIDFFWFFCGCLCCVFICFFFFDYFKFGISGIILVNIVNKCFLY